MKRIDDLAISGKRVLMRLDLDVPVKDGKVTDRSRLEAGIPSIIHVLKNNGTLTIMGHLGRPDEKLKKADHDEEMKIRKEKSAAPLIASFLMMINEDGISLKEEDVFFCDDYYDGHYDRESLPDKKIILLENLRFDQRERSKDPHAKEWFAKTLKAFGDCYVNDAFGNSHRDHVSMVSLPLMMESAAGFKILDEVKKIEYLVKDPERPFVAILGGAKVADKVKVIKNLKADRIIIVGAMKYAFDRAKGRSIGKSLCLGVEEAEEILQSAIKQRLYVADDDIVVTKKDFGLDYSTIRTLKGMESMAHEEAGLDIGHLSIERIRSMIKDAKTIVWNGPAGLFEDDHFAAGTFAIANLLAESDAKVFIGGGDSQAAIEKSGHSEKDYYYISTGGGAMLTILGGDRLPSLEALGYY